MYYIWSGLLNKEYWFLDERDMHMCVWYIVFQCNVFKHDQNFQGFENKGLTLTCFGSKIWFAFNCKLFFYPLCKHRLDFQMKVEKKGNRIPNISLS